MRNAESFRRRRTRRKQAFGEEVGGARETWGKERNAIEEEIEERRKRVECDRRAGSEDSG
jgi:hypothetical protein